MKDSRTNLILKVAVAMLGLYALVWISLEGRLWQAIVLAVGLVASGNYLVKKRYFTNRNLSTRYFIVATGLIGLVDGLLIGVLILLLMVIKTGLHSHGPEFSQVQFFWVVFQMPILPLAGLLAGLGIGLVAVGIRKS